jgi:probable rRNA maturation factor
MYHEVGMEQEHPLIELYISVGDDQQNTAIEQMLAAVNLDDVVLRTLQAVGITQQVMLTLLVTDDDGIRDMNTQYRQQDKPTDVLSFPLLEAPLVQAPADQLWAPQENEEASGAQGQQVPFVTPPGMTTNLGDIVMSWPTLVRQATEAGHAPVYELLYLLSHGVLHLVGYDDHTEAGYQAMVSIQRSVMQAIGQKG